MAEPTASLMPTAYDNATTLLGDLIDQRSFILQSDINDSVTTIPTVGNLGDIEVPVYLHFTATDEIVFAEGTSGNDFTSCVRGARGSSNQSHTAGEVINLVLSGNQFIMFRECIIAGQKYQGLVGTDASKPATPAQNAVYFATDTDKLYVCLTAGSWTWVGGQGDHHDLVGLGDDDHSQYHNDSRKATWHDGLSGGHVTDGDSHHHGQSATDGAARVQNGTSGSRPGTPTYVGELYYETDTGDLYISRDTSNWVKITGAPTGAVAPFTEAIITSEYSGSCPPGWSRYTGLDGRLAKGAPTGVTSPLNNGGSLTHTHTYDEVPEHLHTVPARTATPDTLGAHTHNFPSFGGVGGDAFHISSGRNAVGRVTSDDGSHRHSFTSPSHDTSLTKKTSDNTNGTSSGTTGSGSTLPAYQEVIWCKKD